MNILHLLRVMLSLSVKKMFMDVKEQCSSRLSCCNVDLDYNTLIANGIADYFQGGNVISIVLFEFWIENHCENH